MFGRAAIRLGIGPHSSMGSDLLCVHAVIDIFCHKYVMLRTLAMKYIRFTILQSFPYRHGLAISVLVSFLHLL